jgi:hypothetical protein
MELTRSEMLENCPPPLKSSPTGGWGEGEAKGLSINNNLEEKFEKEKM